MGKVKSFSLNDMLLVYPNLNETLFTRHGQSRPINLIGQKFNHLTVIYRSSANGRGGWVCQCDCGCYIFYTTCKLRSGEATSCSPRCPYKKQKTHDLNGKQFGELLVLRRNGNTADGHAQWLCRCSCGAYTNVAGRYLEHGRISSCGGCDARRKSRGNQRVFEWLKNNNVNFKPEQRLEGCVFKSKLIFDFVIYNGDSIIGCIEYQGIQHYQPTGGWITSDMVRSQQIKDNIKKEYCQKEGIPLLCVSYLDYENIDQILKQWVESISLTPTEKK